MSERYWRPAPHNSGTHTRRVNQIRKLARGFAGCSVAELGCGTGEIGWRLRLDGMDVTAIDCNDSRVIASMRPWFIKQDAVTADVSGYDLIVCAGLLYHLDIKSQETLAANLRGKIVILDTHFCRQSPQKCGDYCGQVRHPTWSTKVNSAFVHTVDSLRLLFRDHLVVETFTRLTADRQVMLLIPRGD